MTPTAIILLCVLGFIIFYAAVYIEKRRRIARRERDRMERDTEQQRQQIEEERRLRTLQLSDVDDMQFPDFNNYVRRLLVHRGYTPHVEQVSCNLDPYVFAEHEGTKYLIQLNLQNSPVSRRAVSEALDEKDLHHCDRVILVTTSHFTKRAITTAHSTNCEMVDRAELEKWVYDFQHPSKPESALLRFEGAWIGEHFLADD